MDIKAIMDHFEHDLIENETLPTNPSEAIPMKIKACLYSIIMGEL